ncbi:MAG: HAMP domain-containing histidine kinase [Pirellulales bacterium]|nr:HAMP domain-containing histidine kinase [Pirellulales bacterium]
MKRSWRIWVVFAICLGVVATAMAWISFSALRLDRAETVARARAALEENVRLALWRMDSALAPMVAQESVRPYFAYSSFLPVDRAYGRMFNPRMPGESLVPSPLLGELPPHVLVHFQFEPDGRLTSPGIPTDANYKLAVPRYTKPLAVENAKIQIDTLGKLIDREKLLAALPKKNTVPVEVVFSPMPITPQQFDAQMQQRASRQSGNRGQNEFDARTQIVAQQSLMQNTANFASLMQDTDTAGVLMTPLWFGEQLLLARRVTVRGQEYVQGCVLDWPALKKWLLEEVADLLPRADLLPAAKNGPEDRQSRRLAALPVMLVPGDLVPSTGASGSGLSPIQLSLLVAWACMLLAAVAVAGLLVGVLRLSERRATFVSAVTHELRTPLTTFKMYAEMLADDMVTDPQRRRQYLQTLRAEADRLEHMVENVLAYARLERGRTNGKVENVALGDLLDQLAPRLSERAARAEMLLDIEIDDTTRATVVQANPSAIDQILFNLVDNSCKYAAGATDRRIAIVARASSLPDSKSADKIEIRIRDHGPGIDRTTAGQLFNGFSKSATQAANSAPGIGLGLALSRRLARDMGATLRLEETDGEGACFVLGLRATAQM